MGGVQGFPMNHPFQPYGGQGMNSGSGHPLVGQKRGLELDGFFEDVKKRRVEPTYDESKRVFLFRFLSLFVLTLVYL